MVKNRKRISIFMLSLMFLSNIATNSVQATAEYKNGHVENYKIKSFTMVNSTIRIKTDDNILYLNYSDIEDIQINS